MAEADAAFDLGVTAPLSLRLLPGECIVIEAGDSAQLDAFADLCSGLVPLRAGQVRCLDHDWTDLSHDYAAALRGRIGRVFESDIGLPFLDAETNILLPQLHHTNRGTSELRIRAAALAREFGLPGLPVGPLVELAPLDAARAMLVRALLGEPALLFLHDPIPPLRAAVLNRIATLLDGGSAVVWLAKTGSPRNSASYAATQWLRLTEQGLTLARPAR